MTTNQKTKCKKKLDPEMEQAFKELFQELTRKNSVRDYPCKDVPCKFWWVRYAVSCTYLSHAQQMIWQPKIEEMENKYHFASYAYSGPWKINSDNLTDYSKVKIWVLSAKVKKQVEVTNQLSDLWRVLSSAIENQVGWGDCPYQMERQSICPFYEANEFYKQQAQTNETKEKQKQEVKP